MVERFRRGALGLIFTILAISAPGPAQQNAAQAPESLAQQIEQSVANGANHQADEMLHNFLAQPSVGADLLLRVGIAFAGRGLYPEASRVFARCAHDHPQVFEAHYNLALAELAQDRLSQALATIDQAPHHSPVEDAARLYLRGKVETALDRRELAERDLAAAFERRPDEENYALDLGVLDLRNGSYSRAESIFARGARSHPESAYLLLGWALAQFLGGRTAGSIQTSRRLLQLHPDFSPARLLLSFSLYLQGNLAEAQKLAAAGLDLPRPDPFLEYLDASILVKQHSQEYPRIFSELDTAAKAIPACGLCYVAAGKAHEQQGSLPDATRDFETAVQVTPHLSDAWYHLAATYARAGRPSDAARARHEFERLKTGNENHEADMLREAFLKTMGAETTNQEP